MPGCFGVAAAGLPAKPTAPQTGTLHPCCL